VILGLWFVSRGAASLLHENRRCLLTRALRVFSALTILAMLLTMTDWVRFELRAPRSLDLPDIPRGDPSTSGTPQVHACSARGLELSAVGSTHQLWQHLAGSTSKHVPGVPGERRVARVDLNDHGPMTQRFEGQRRRGLHETGGAD
jgi:hypothetical protein